MPYVFNASLTLAQKTRVVAAYCTRFRYPGVPVPAGVTGDGSAADKARFFQACIATEIRKTVRSVEGVAAGAAAQSAQELQVNTDLAGID